MTKRIRSTETFYLDFEGKTYGPFSTQEAARKKFAEILLGLPKEKAIKELEELVKAAEQEPINFWPIKEEKFPWPWDKDAQPWPYNPSPVWCSTSASFKIREGQR